MVVLRQITRNGILIHLLNEVRGTFTIMSDDPVKIGQVPVPQADQMSDRAHLFWAG
jgi:hypothetical protein